MAVSLTHDRRSLDYVLIVLMVLPNLVWILIDRQLWTSDASMYGLSALKVHYALTSDHARWWPEMLSVSPKPPMLPWLGQWLVPVGRMLGSIDSGLLLVPFFALLLSLWLTYRTHVEYFQHRSAALVACLAIASTPLFLDASREFNVQSLQLAGVAWFVYIMAKAPRWDAAFISLHLIAATACAMLVILSFPVFVAVPAAISVGHMWKKRMAGLTWSRSHTAMLLLALVAMAGVAAWYARNAVDALAYAGWAFQYRFAGVPDGLLTKLSVWGLRLFGGFMLPALIMMAAFPRAISTRDGLIIAVAVQIILVLVVLSLSAQQTNRYILALAPSMALAIGWVVSRIQNRRAILAIAGLLIVQLAVVQVLEVGVTRPSRDLGSTQALPIAQSRAREVLDTIINVMSEDPPGLLVLGTGSLGLFNVQLEYEAAKRPPYLERYFAGRAQKSDSVEFMLAGSSTDGQTERTLEQVWADIEQKAVFVVVVPRQTREGLLERRRSKAGRGDAGWLRLLRGGSDFADLVEASDVFDPIALPVPPEIAIFARARNEHAR